MNTIRQFPINWRLFIISILTILISSCAVGTSEPGAWIDFPRAGSIVFVGKQQTIISHSYASDGVVEAVLIVNGEEWKKITPSDPGANLTEFGFEWIPQAEGLYTLQVIANGANGEEITSKPVTVNSVRELAVITSTGVLSMTLETAMYTPTLVATPTDTATPTETPTPTTQTDTPTSTPVVPVIQFWAEPSTINAGECTSIRWYVENVKTVIFGGLEQPFEGSYRDCLCSDQRYTLTIIHLDNSEEKRRIDISVQGVCVTPTPPDETPPPVPQPAVPADNLVLSCRATQNLVWVPVTDPSGVAGYYVRLERRANPRLNWEAVNTWGLINDKQFTVKVACGYYYRWNVLAEDNAGNRSNWSDWSQFSVTLQ